MGSRAGLSSSEINKHLQRQADSGLSVRDYCREHGLSKSSFYQWRLNRERAKKHGTDSWVELTAPYSGIVDLGKAPVEDATDNGVVVELVLPGGIVLRVRPSSSATS